MKTITKLVITRSKWSTPDTLKKGEMNFLLRSNGRMCCLGFACIELGLKEEDILKNSMPNVVIHETSQLTKPLLWQKGMTDSALSYDAAEINDNKDITNEQREVKLIELFAKNNITLSFVD